MIFKTIGKQDLSTLFDVQLKGVECVGPKRVAITPGGRSIYQFLPLEDFAEADLTYGKTEYSAKTYFIPFRETLSSFTFHAGGWEQTIRYRIQPRVIFGLHACDINALIKLDKVMAQGPFPNPYYLSRRANTFVIGLDCPELCPGGFCTAMGTHTVTHGFDLFLTDIGDRYFVKVGSERGFDLITRIEARDITPDDGQAYRERSNAFSLRHEPAVRVENFSEILDIEFESEVWDKWGERCMGCGTCAMVCPTCYCYGVHERPAMDFSSGEKIKELYACTVRDFSEVAGGHNFRPGRATRLKYRYYHQHRGFVESFGEPMCVGCNRCGDACLSGINPVAVIRDLQMEDTR
ncbi:4Fe-4S dicluster domain-containing protein [Desulfatiferula olefinivorans]